MIARINKNNISRALSKEFHFSLPVLIFSDLKSFPLCFFQLLKYFIQCFFLGLGHFLILNNDKNQMAYVIFLWKSFLLNLKTLYLEEEVYFSFIKLPH
jgi:hypothetical protein